MNKDNYLSMIEELSEEVNQLEQNQTWLELKELDSELMKQFIYFKEQRPNHIIFLQVGDFFELYDSDAIVASEVLGMKLTKREIGGKSIPMCGMPQKNGNDFANRLAKEGHYVSLIVQDKNEKGEVKRKFWESITPGTVQGDLIEQDQNQFIMTVYEFKKDVGVVLFDSTTGEIKTRLTNRYGIFDLIERFNPKEILVYLPFLWEEELLNKLKRVSNCQIYNVPRFYDEMRMAIETHKEEQFKNEFVSYAIIAAHYFMLHYIKAMQGQHVTLRPIQYIDERNYLFLHKTALAGLDVLENEQTKKKKGSLFDLLDLCVTAKGSRLLKSWLQEPLLDSVEIEKRYRIVDSFVKNNEYRKILRESLQGTPDVERVIGRFENARYKDTDLVLLKVGLDKINSFLDKVIKGSNSPALIDLTKKHFNRVNEIALNLNQKIDENEIVAVGYNSEYDKVKEIKEKGVSLIEEHFEELKETFKTKSLKLKENKVLGYFFELTLNQLKQIEKDLTEEEWNNFNELFIERGKVTNGKRFVTEELKDLEDSLLNAEEEYGLLYKKTIRKIVSETLSFHEDINKILEFVSTFDVLLSFSEVSVENNFCKPTIDENNHLLIKKGKHPLLQKFHYKKTISNNAIIKSENVYLITGPNMGGKSIYLKMVGLLTIMAQVGCFVPAEKMIFTPVDRILLRMGASDSLLEEQSTFALEMDEVAYILFHATKNSLVLMDELGRGTSTNDGIAIATAVIEELHNKINCKTVCSTHYHELIELNKNLQRFSNLHAEAKTDEKGNINLTYKIINGGSPNSFGIEVAKKSGIPTHIIRRAQNILEKS